MLAESAYFCAISACAAAVFAGSPTVTISAGEIIGTTLSPLNQPTSTGHANAYLGIPFAKSPPERFSPPETPDSWENPLRAQELKPACIQQATGRTPTQDFLAEEWNIVKLHQSEDCLYLNVYAPEDASPSNKKAVLFWIHGGNLQIGSASFPFYNGTSLAVNEDVVVVTINYRLGVFGFSNCPEICKKERNVGFLDQRLALDWVSRNIEQFGGDATRVTIFGQSAGGYSVKQLVANPPTPQPFQAAIIQSQQVLLGRNGKENYYKLLKAFNCRDLPCLRDVPAEDIKVYTGLKRLSFPPTSDDATSLTDVRDSFCDNKFANTPIMLGTTKDEATIFVKQFFDLAKDPWASEDLVFDFLGLGDERDRSSLKRAYPDAVNPSPFAQEFSDLAPLERQYPDGLRALPPNERLMQSVVQSEGPKYFGGRVYHKEEPPFGQHQVLDDLRSWKLALLSRIVTDLVFNCPTASISGYISDRGYNVWRYRYCAAFPNLTPFPDAGAWHGTEIPEVFGTYPLKNDHGKATEQQIRLSAHMQHVWAEFAKNPDKGPGWAKVQPNSSDRSLADFGSNGSSKHAVVPWSSVDAACKLVQTYSDLLGFAW
ncbi:carboxylesterase [Penicillium desertorum]|uniref:Carboxylic ester hydrolase n=1 Tax=Penicillium desertorum TaxID=1303715 RepID=A0A9W9XBP3_9EURO|nr:carboxylesterase [Penicillium desertorum]